MTRKQRARLALTIFGALVAGGGVGAGVGTLWSPAVAVTISIFIGLAAGGVVLRAALKSRRDAADRRG